MRTEVVSCDVCLATIPESAYFDSEEEEAPHFRLHGRYGLQAELCSVACLARYAEVLSTTVD